MVVAWFLQQTALSPNGDLTILSLIGSAQKVLHDTKDAAQTGAFWGFLLIYLAPHISSDFLRPDPLQ